MKTEQCFSATHPPKKLLKRFERPFDLGFWDKDKTRSKHSEI